MIKPTIGRVLLVFRQANPSGQPEPALISYVHSDTSVNVGGFDANGHPFNATSLYLDQGDVPRPSNVGDYAEWMPYQKAVAAGEVVPTKHA